MGIVRNSNLLLLEKISGLVLGVISLRLITTILQPETYGQFALLLSIGTIAATLLNGWLAMSISVVGRKLLAEDGHFTRLYKPKLLINAALFFVFAALLLALRRWVGEFLLTEYWLPLTLAWAVSCILLLDSQQLATAMDRIDLVALSGLGTKLFLTASYAALLAIDSCSLQLVVLINILANLGAAAIIFVFGRPKFPGLLTADLDMTTSVRMLRYSWPFIGITMCSQAYMWMDQYAIRTFSNMAEVGLYQLAFNLLNVLHAFIAIVSTVLTPYFVTLSQDRERFQSLLNTVWPQAVMLLTLGLFCFGIFHDSIFLLLSPSFKAAESAFKTLYTGLFFLAFISILSITFSIYERTRLLFYFAIAYTLANFTVDIILVPILGARGAAFGTVSAYAVDASLVYLFFKKDFQQITTRWTGAHFIFVSLYLGSLLYFDMNYAVRLWLATLSLGYAYIMIAAYKVFAREDAIAIEKLDIKAPIKRRMVALLNRLPSRNVTTAQRKAT